MATQKQRSDSTRAQLLKAFRASFLKVGFDATTTQQVLTETGLSKGAMYHHFRSKTEIARVMYEEESRRAIDSAFKSVASAPTPVAKLKGACLAWTREVRLPDVSKILFEIGPSALGPETAKNIENSYSLKLIEELLEQAIMAGQLKALDSELVAAFLNALVAETALYTQRTGKDAMSALASAIDALFASFRV